VFPEENGFVQPAILGGSGVAKRRRLRVPALLCTVRKNFSKILKLRPLVPVDGL